MKMTRTGRNLTRYHGDLDTLIGKSVCNAQFNAEVPDGAYIKEVSSPDTVYIAWKDDEGGFGNVGNRGLAEVGFSDPSDEQLKLERKIKNLETPKSCPHCGVKWAWDQSKKCSICGETSLPQNAEVSHD